MFDNVVYEFDKSDMPQQLLDSVLSPLSWTHTMIDSLHC
jgi:hypothetical protein